MEVIITAGR